GRRVRQELIEIADALPLARAQRLCRIVMVAERAHGRELRADVEHAVVANGDHGGPVDPGEPSSSDQGAARTVLGQDVFLCECDHGGHGFPFISFLSSGAHSRDPLAHPGYGCGLGFTTIDSPSASRRYTREAKAHAFGDGLAAVASICEQRTRSRCAV